MRHASTIPTTLPAHAAKHSQLQTTPVSIAPGRALWLYVDAGSTLYCSAGQVQIGSPWHSSLLLHAEDTPHCTGAHAGWYWVEAHSPELAQLQISGQPHTGWGALWQTTARWLGLRD